MSIEDVTRNYGPSSSQSITTEAIGHAEDISKVITNIAPDMAFFLSRFKDGEDAESLVFKWHLQTIKPPGVNAHAEVENYTASKWGSLEIMDNHCQRFVSDAYISEDERDVAKTYSETALSLMRTDLYRRHAHDLEYAIVNNDVARKQLSDSKPAMTGGIPYFMASQTITANIDTATGVITTTADHNLNTGDFVYFSATTMPTGLKEKMIYYVRVDATAPDTKFTVFNTMKDAVENIAVNQVKPTSAGTAVKIVKNNVIDCGGGDFTLNDINDAMYMAYHRGGNPTLAVMSPAKKRQFSELVTASTTINREMTKGRKLELVADVFQTDAGVITAEAHRMYPDNRIDLLQMDMWALRWFKRTHEVEGIAKLDNTEKMFIESKFGLQGTQPKASASLINIKR